MLKLLVGPFTKELCKRSEIRLALHRKPGKNYSGGLLICSAIYSIFLGRLVSVCLFFFILFSPVSNISSLMSVCRCCGVTYGAVVLFIKSIPENSPCTQFLILRMTSPCSRGVGFLHGEEKCHSVMNRTHLSTVVFVVFVCNVF